MELDTISVGSLESYTVVMDNNHIVKAVFTKLTDINRDGKVDIIDLARVSAAFGSYLSQAKWDPFCDTSEDNKIDIMDIARVAASFS